MYLHLLLAFASAGISAAVWTHPFASPSLMRVPVSAAFAGLACWQVVCGCRACRDERRKPKPILRLGGFAWNLNDFCRGWLITGETGSGKTQAVINTMLWQVTMNCPNWGGICIDDKMT